jgi:TolB-like protein/Flp pilus assembly protein TadD
MGEPSLGVQPSEKSLEERLDSWKEIAAYLNRDVTTVQRWEKREGMPVHRHLHDKRGSVYAISSELDAWQQSRNLVFEEDEKKLAESPGTGEGGLGKKGPKPRLSPWVALGALMAAVVLLAVVYTFSRSHPPANPTHTKIQSLAVLPLKNLSGDPAQDYLADGMTEALIGRLAGIHDLRVISHTSVLRFKNPQISVPEIAKELNVDAIVEGSVIREGNRIRVTAQLIRGATDEHFWSETYDRQLQDVLGLQSELAQSIAERVEVTITGEEQQRLSAARPVAPEVYESYLKGRFINSRGKSRADIEQGLSYFSDSIKRDPTFAPAYVGLANSYTALGTIFGGASPSETRPKVMSAAQKALELDPSLAEAHVLLANVLQEEWHWGEAGSEYKRALELAPNSAAAHAGYALWLLCQGRTDEAVDWILRARELDPVAVSGVSVGWILFLSRRYDETIREDRSVVAVQPESAPALWDIGFALIAKGQAQEAIPVLEKALAVSNRSAGVMGVLIRAYAHTGRRAEALRLLAELQERRKKGYVPAGAFVNAYLGLDDKENSFAALEQAYKEQSNILQFLKVHPYFDPLRSDPRFADLVRRVGLS